MSDFRSSMDVLLGTVSTIDQQLPLGSQPPINITSQREARIFEFRSGDLTDGAVRYGRKWTEFDARRWLVRMDVG